MSGQGSRIVSTMNVFPGSEMPFYPTSWHSIDVDRGWVFCEFLNRMRDPGDGSVHQAANLSVMKYAGDNLWSYEEKRLQPDEFLADGAVVCRAESRHGHRDR